MDFGKRCYDFTRRAVFQSVHEFFVQPRTPPAPSISGNEPGNAYGWQVTRDDQAVYVLMHPRQHRERKFMVRINCDDFDTQPPSYQFVDPETRVASVDYMPTGRGFMPAWNGVCIHGTREFYELGHPDQRSRWSSKEYPFARVLQEIQVLINQAYP